MNNSNEKLSYADAGVDIDAGNALVERIKPAAARTHRSGVMSGLGGFGACFDLKASGFNDPILVSCTDGVGTKLKLAQIVGDHSTIGIDLVAMCVNDLIVQGAEPLFFLDYFATAGLDIDTTAAVVEGIADGCEQSGCALVGGETAEMPDMYAPGDYDLAGFCVGAVERNAIIDGSSVTAGDVLIGVGSSGPHSNGYSLIRKVIEVSGADVLEDFAGQTLGKVLLEPTRLYVKPVLQLFKQFNIKALSHITGGGLPENLPRVLPDNTKAIVNTGSWQWPAIFKWLQDNGNIDTAEMYRTFNCGVGLVLVVTAADADAVINNLQVSGENAWLLGNIKTSETSAPSVTFAD